MNCNNEKNNWCSQYETYFRDFKLPSRAETEEFSLSDLTQDEQQGMAPTLKGKVFSHLPWTKFLVSFFQIFLLSGILYIQLILLSSSNVYFHLCKLFQVFNKKDYNIKIKWHEMYTNKKNENKILFCCDKKAMGEE